MAEPSTDREILTRLDERTINIWRAVDEIQKQQIAQNGLIAETLKRSNSNSGQIRGIKWALGIGIPLLIAWLSYTNFVA
uniref:Uncharacterized protein n=1 Tax=viral metagenome TaxID=1070528 RepID=A0A6M3J2H9_9ZZZZ